MKTKVAHCEKCCPDGGAILSATFDMDGKPVWKCQNCYNETKRITQRRPDESSPLTPSQLREITRIQQYHLRMGKVVKELRVTNLGHCVSVVAIVGSENDEGTMAAVLCRYRGHFFVGRSGKVEAVDPSDKAKAKKYPLIYGWRS